MKTNKVTLAARISSLAGNSKSKAKSVGMEWKIDTSKLIDPLERAKIKKRFRVVCFCCSLQIAFSLMSKAKVSSSGLNCCPPKDRSPRLSDSHFHFPFEHRNRVWWHVTNNKKRPRRGLKSFIYILRFSRSSFIPSIGIEWWCDIDAAGRNWKIHEVITQPTARFPRRFY